MGFPEMTNPWTEEELEAAAEAVQHVMDSLEAMMPDDIKVLKVTGAAFATALVKVSQCDRCKGCSAMANEMLEKMREKWLECERREQSD